MKLAEKCKDSKKHHTTFVILSDSEGPRLVLASKFPKTY